MPKLKHTDESRPDSLGVIIYPSKVPQIATSGLSGFKSFEKNFDKIGSDRSFSPAGSDRSSISNHEPPQNTHQDVTGYQRQKE